MAEKTKLTVAIICSFALLPITIAEMTYYSAYVIKIPFFMEMIPRIGYATLEPNEENFQQKPPGSELQSRMPGPNFVMQQQPGQNFVLQQPQGPQLQQDYAYTGYPSVRLAKPLPPKPTTYYPYTYPTTIPAKGFQYGPQRAPATITSTGQPPAGIEEEEGAEDFHDEMEEAER